MYTVCLYRILSCVTFRIRNNCIRSNTIQHSYFKITFKRSVTSTISWHGYTRLTVLFAFFGIFIHGIIKRKKKEEEKWWKNNMNDSKKLLVRFLKWFLTHEELQWNGKLSLSRVTTCTCFTAESPKRFQKRIIYANEMVNIYGSYLSMTRHFLKRRKESTLDTRRFQINVLNEFDTKDFIRIANISYLWFYSC